MKSLRLFVFKIYAFCLYYQKNFYTGETPDVESRLGFHNDPNKNTNTTKSGISWEFFWKLEVVDRSLARRIELHMKKMKSRKYIEDLKQYPEISIKLIKKYSDPLL